MRPAPRQPVGGGSGGFVAVSPDDPAAWAVSPVAFLTRSVIRRPISRTRSRTSAPLVTGAVRRAASAAGSGSFIKGVVMPVDVVRARTRRKPDAAPATARRGTRPRPRNAEKSPPARAYAPQV